MRVAVAAGDADAMNALGSMLLRDDEKATGEARDREAAVRLFAEAGARGCAAADYNLAACLEAGAGVEKDAEKAKSLFRRALSLGVFRAHLPLGYLALRHDADLGAAARHFSAISGDVPGDVSAKRLEALGIGEGDVAEATFCLADVSERAADVGLARLERVRASGAVPVDEKRLVALREDGGATYLSSADDATDDASDLSLHRGADEAAARRDVTLLVLATSSAEEDANAAEDLCGRWRARANARARSRAAPPSSATGAPRFASAYRCGARLPRSGAGKKPLAAREAAATWVARGAAAGLRRRVRLARRRAMRGACRLDGVSDGTTPARRTRALRGWGTRRARGAWRRWRKRRGARRRRLGGSASTRRRRRKRGGGACHRNGSTKPSRAGRSRQRLRSRDTW